MTTPDPRTDDGLPEEIRAGLLGMRLALYDEALAAGPRGLSLAELRARTLEDALLLRQSYDEREEALAWLRGHGLVVEFQPGKFRGNRRPETGDRKPETGNDGPAVAQLRTPAIEAKTRRGGQLAFF